MVTAVEIMNIGLQSSVYNFIKVSVWNIISTIVSIVRLGLKMKEISFRNQ